MQILATHWSALSLVVLVALVKTNQYFHQRPETLLPKAGQEGGQKPQSAWYRLCRLPKTLLVNSANALVFLLTGGTQVLHEGRFHGRLHRWSNWNGTVTFRPTHVECPPNEDRLSQHLQQTFPRKVRVIGTGHSFNTSSETTETVVALVNYRLDNGEQWKLLRKDEQGGVVRVAAGMRLRDLTRVLRKEGLAVPVLGSADAQTLGGLLATDVHGTGREHGFLSEQVVSLRLMDAQGQARELHRHLGTPEEQEAFRAALGGMGACGIITELQLECVPHFNLEKASWFLRLEKVDALLERIVRDYAHVSLYEVGGLKHVRLNTWTPTLQPTPWWMRLQRLSSELSEFFISGFVFELAFAWLCKRKLIMAAVFILLKLLGQDNKRSIQPAGIAFTRTLYFHHDELEYAVPYRHYKQCMGALRRMLEEERFMTVIEVRFTPPGKTVALLGPGADDEQRRCFIGLTPTLSYSQEERERVFALAADILQRHGGQVHLGKNPAQVTASRMHQMHGARFESFQQVRERQDPRRRFSNAFMEKVLGP